MNIHNYAFPTGNGLMVLSEFILIFSFAVWFPDDNFLTPRRIVPKFSPIMGHGQRKNFVVKKLARSLSMFIVMFTGYCTAIRS